MPQYVYSFESAVGTFWIRQERDKSWSLSIGDEGTIEVIGYWDSDYDAADAVYMHCTGWGGWDKRVGVDHGEWLQTQLEEDGYLWGRGSVDMKPLGIANLEAFLLLHRNHVPLRRDVIFANGGGNRKSVANTFYEIASLIIFSKHWLRPPE